jgi:hypothetical protein
LLLRDQNREILLLRQQLLIMQRHWLGNLLTTFWRSWPCCWRPCAFPSGAWPRPS